MKIIILTLLLIHFTILIANSQWIQQNSGTNQNLYDIEFINEKTGWAVGDAGVWYSCGVGRIYKTTTGGQLLTNIILSNSEVPLSFYLFQNHPNPFNIVTNIEFEIKENSINKLEIYNLLGQKIEEIFNKNLNTGKYKILYNAEKLSSGTYIYRISSDKFSISKKFILLK